MSGYETGRFHSFEEAYSKGRAEEREAIEQEQDDNGSADPKGLTRERIEAMSQEEINENWGEISKFLREEGR